MKFLTLAALLLFLPASGPSRSPATAHSNETVHRVLRSFRSDEAPAEKLWANISVSEPMLYWGPNAPSHEAQFFFGLVNDGEVPANTDARSWTITINGQPIAESGFIFGNGPGPVGGWGTLRPGEAYIFGKSLRMKDYFPNPGIYEVAWKGSGFSARPVILRVLPPAH